MTTNNVIGYTMLGLLVLAAGVALALFTAIALKARVK